MSTQICNKCGILKDIVLFSPDRRREGRRYKVCTECKRLAKKQRRIDNPEKYKLMQRAYYETHKDYYKIYWQTHKDKKSKIQETYYDTHFKQIATVHRDRKKLRKEYWIDYLGGICSLCKGTFDFYQYDFHHIDPSIKDKNVSRILASGGHSTVQSEIDKCILLCANCHRKVHHAVVK